MTVKELLARLDSPEITEWIAFFDLQSAPEKPQLTEEEAWQRAFGISNGK